MVTIETDQSCQFCKITGYYHTKYTIRIKKTGHFEKIWKSAKGIEMKLGL